MKKEVMFKKIEDLLEKHGASAKLKEIMQVIPGELQTLKKEKCFYVYRDKDGNYYNLNIARSYACAGIAFQGFELVKITKISEVMEVCDLPISDKLFLESFLD